MLWQHIDNSFSSPFMAGNEFEECYPAEKNALLEWKDYEGKS